MSVEPVAGGFRSPRVGLLEGRTGVPLVLLFLRGADEVRRFELHSARDVEARLAEATFAEDRAAWETVLPFFESDGSRALVVTHPLSADRSTWLETMLGADRGLARRTGLHSLKSLREVADLAVIPQASLLLDAEEHRRFYQGAFDLASVDPHYFFILDFPARFAREDAAIWLKGVVCPDAAAYYPWIVREGRLVPPAMAVAAAVQASDERFGIHHLPANQPLKGTVMPLVDLTPSELTESLRHRLNALHRFADGTTRLWGGSTLADRFDHDARFISTRRTALAVREAIHRICEPFVLEPIYPGLDQAVDIALQSAFQPLRRFFDADARNPFETEVRLERSRGQDIVQVDVRCSVPYALGELKFSLGLVA